MSAPPEGAAPPPTHGRLCAFDPATGTGCDCDMVSCPWCVAEGKRRAASYDYEYGRGEVGEGHYAACPLAAPRSPSGDAPPTLAEVAQALFPKSRRMTREEQDNLDASVWADLTPLTFTEDGDAPPCTRCGGAGEITWYSPRPPHPTPSPCPVCRSVPLCARCGTPESSADHHMHDGTRPWSRPLHAFVAAPVEAPHRPSQWRDLGDDATPCCKYGADHFVHGTDPGDRDRASNIGLVNHTYRAAVEAPPCEICAGRGWYYVSPGLTKGCQRCHPDSSLPTIDDVRATFAAPVEDARTPLQAIIECCDSGHHYGRIRFLDGSESRDGCPVCLRAGLSRLAALTEEVDRMKLREAQLFEQRDFWKRKAFGCRDRNMALAEEVQRLRAILGVALATPEVDTLAAEAITSSRTTPMDPETH